nr:TonB-dependent receptor [uncultured Flavobacterium sp.]
MNLLMTTFMLLLFQIGFAQQRQISGTVQEPDGFPLPGASVVIKGTTIGTSTDMDGKFQLSASTGDVITVSFLGYKTQEITVTSNNNYSVSMIADQNELEELVVVGYGVQKKKDVTGAISQIKGEEIQNLVTPSFDQQLAGRAAGVQVTTNGGVLGEAPRIRIRGTSSISSGNGPLVVLDGVPLISSNIGGVADVNPLADINPNDIESYEVLKDGSATAIYGSRAANGVILITTKKGKKNSFDINYSAMTGIGSPMKKYDLLNGDQFTIISNEKRSNAGLGPWASQTGVNTNWQNVVLRNSAAQMDHNLSLSSGTENGRYYLSLGYSEQEGSTVANDLKKYSIRASVEQDLNKRITIGGSVALNRNDLNAMNKSSSGLGGIMFNSLRQLPNVPVYDASNPTGYNVDMNGSGDPLNEIGYLPNFSKSGGNLYNIQYALDKNFYKSKINRNIVNLFTNVKLFEGLTYRFQVAYDYAFNDDRTFWSPLHGDGYGYNGLFQQYNVKEELYNVQNILNYNKTFGDNHNIGLTGVYEVQKNTYSYNAAVGRDMTSDFFNQNIVTGAFSTQNIYGSMTEHGIKSLVGRASYNYASKYYLQASIRRDEISKLHPSNRAETMVGYSAGWNIANENFWEGIRGTVNEFKLRGSYAETGNTSFSNYAYQGLYGLQNYGDLNGIGYTQFGNNNLFWEKSTKLDLGVDLAFLNNRIRLAADYFQNTSKDMILQKAVPPSFGVPFNIITVNAGEMVNRGIELDLTANVINTKDFEWIINANATFQKNEVRKLPDGKDIFLTYSDVATLNNNNVIREGESIHSIYGFEYHGVNQANGNPIFVKADGTLVQQDLNDNSYSVYDVNNPTDMSVASTLSATNDRKVLGNVDPTYFGGITNTFKYKNVDLNFLIRFSGGNEIFNYTRRELLTQSFNNNSTEILGRWQSPTNPGDGVTPRLDASNDAGFTGSLANTRFVEKGDFIFLDNIQIGYSFDKKLLERVNMKKARLFITAQNVWMITDYKGIDPEMVTSYGTDSYGVPRNRIISMGLNVGF